MLHPIVIDSFPQSNGRQWSHLFVGSFVAGDKKDGSPRKLHVPGRLCKMAFRVGEQVVLGKIVIFSELDFL